VPVWTVAEILAHTGIRSPNRPARYPGYQLKNDILLELLNYKFLPSRVTELGFFLRQALALHCKTKTQI